MNKLTQCTQCQLRQHCINPVGSSGPYSSPLMIIAEAPGADEDREKIPLIGKSGQLLDTLLWQAGITRDKIYVSNIVKCRPPGNRTPDENECNNCAKLWLQHELELVAPKVIIALGATAMKYFGNNTMRITKNRGNFFIYKNIYIMPTFHPSYLLRNHNTAMNNLVVNDIIKAKTFAETLVGNYEFSSGKFIPIQELANILRQKKE